MVTVITDCQNRTVPGIFSLFWLTFSEKVRIVCMKANDGVNYNRNYKDTLFRKLFGENRENALSLYNAVNGTHYTNAEDLEFTTLDDVVYMKMKNDVSFIFGNYLNLYEHQSTLNPNMPLRGLLYFADMYRQIIPASERIYGSKLQEIPAPKYIVFYNGTDRLEGGRKVLHLSDAFRPFGVSEGFEWTATVIDINYGANADIMENCKVLSEYAQFIAKIREECGRLEKAKSNNQDILRQAIDAATEYCIQNDILKDFLEKNRKEVMDVCLTEFNQERYNQIVREEGREEGEVIGYIHMGEKMGLTSQDIIRFIVEETEISQEEAKRLYEEYKGK